MMPAPAVSAPSAGRFRALLPSPLPGVSAEAWRRFYSALDVQPIGAISDSGGVGSFDLRPRRLVELGYATNLRYEQTPTGRYVHACDFLAPWTLERFRSDLMAQLRALGRSVSLHHKEIADGKVKIPEGVSLAGALAILHVGGRGALAGWPDLFDNTRARYEAARGAF